MASPHTPLRTIAALILLGLTAVLCAGLGNWQLDRAAQRDAIRQAMETGRQSAVLMLEPNIPASELRDWRIAQANGVWLHEFTVLLANRNYKGRPGFWVATPLLLQGEPRTAVLVLRGWLPRPIGPGESLPPLPRPTEAQLIEGQLVSHVPRLFELWSFGDTGASTLPADFFKPENPAPQVQNLDLENFARVTGLKLLPAVLEQTSTAQTESQGQVMLNRDWPMPPIDSDTNRGYALQWFSFAAIAGLAFLVIAWRALRRRHQSSAAHRNTPPGS